MKYINNNTFEPTPGAATRFLESLGITRVESFLYKPKPSDYEIPWNLQNMRTLIERLHEGFETNKKFFIQVDSDTDGITSSAIFYNFFKRIYPNAYIDYRMHDGKEHGVILDYVPFEVDYVIIPDAGSNQIEEMEELRRTGRVVLVMDHHIMNSFITEEDKDSITIVNNQDGKYQNKQLSGAGVVYKTIQAYCEFYGLGNIYKDYEDLAALGIIADCMDCRNLDNNAIVMNGLSHIVNPMFKELLRRQSADGMRIKDIENPTKIDVAFYIAPLTNAFFRSGTIEEKDLLFNGFIGVGNDKVYTHDFRGVHYEENLYEFVGRTAVNLRAKQNRIKDKSLEILKNMVESQNLNVNKAMVLKVGSEIVDKNLTGLVAIDIVNAYGKPTLVLRPVVEYECGEKVIYYRGSGRAQPVIGFDNFMKVLQDSGLMDYVEGHENAFGASIRESNIPALNEYLNRVLADIDFTSCPQVDCCMDDDNWNNIVLKEFGMITRVFGNGIPETKFHFEFDANTIDFRIQGKKNDSLKINHNGVTLISFKCEDIIEQYMNLSNTNPTGKIHVEIIGVAAINNWNGYDNVQIMVKDIELSKCESQTMYNLF